MVVAWLLASSSGACVEQGTQGGRSRADTYQRTNPREGMGAGGGDVGKPPRDMPGSGRGSATPHGK
jgi:hypothetical protein